MAPLRCFMILALFQITVISAAPVETFKLTRFAAPPAPVCFHEEDNEDHKCFEACSHEGTFTIKGLGEAGGCPDKYNTIDTVKTVLQCPDGVTNVRYCSGTALNVTIATKGEALVGSTAKKIAVIGDSWGTVVAGGSKLGLSFFARKLKEHKCDAHETSYAVPGTTAEDWDKDGMEADSLKKALESKPDYIWFIIFGNDALADMPDCASTKKSAEECGDVLYAKSVKHLESIADTIHAASPNTKLVGFGYDTMFGGLGCSLVTRSLFPQCYFPHRGGGNACFNKQFLRIQQVWEDVAANRTWVDATSILGVTQVAAGDTKASTGADRHIDMDKMGPAKYWPDYEGCFHPGVLGGDNSGAMVVMEEFHRVYWAKELGC